ncbi:myeloid cell surface antigen CD33-like [Anoplopoma fimbria]|uniref:myeloid cell surface antigen CD33-like n=1 Tax=Anoplopoma fimbria TaxID=229290 RepID=UPI0023EAA2F6|nr:myeloid cell surface antigen CD33-like [Anoplopoma fimbria]
MVTNNMLLSLLFVSGAWANCLKQLYVTAPQEMEALSGSCLLIPCNFSAEPVQDFNSTRTTFGVWIKKDSRFSVAPNNVIFNSSGAVTTYPMRFTGNLSEKNCTTLFSSLIQMYTDVYFFRVENKPFMATASCDRLQITVQDSPPSPRIEISGVLKEKESVSISCSALTPCPHSPPELTWNLLDPHNIIEENKDRTFTTKIQKNFTLSDKHDGLNITCSASYPVNEGKDVKTAEQRKTLSVSYAPKDTSASISPSGQVSAGSWVNLTCSSRANPPVSSFTWFKNSKDGPVKVSEGDVYSFNVTDGGVYYCVAINELGDEKSSEVHLNKEGVKQLESFTPWIAVVGGIIVLICAGFAIWWLKSKRSTLQRTQSLTAEEPAAQERARATETEAGDIHYGEIDFSKLRPGKSSTSVHDSGQEQDTLYAQVKVSKTVKSLTQTADSPEDLYAQML